MELSSSTLVRRLVTNVISEIEPTGTGTRSATPSNLPVYSGKTFVVAIAAPVVFGTMFCAAALPRRSCGTGVSTSDCVAVYA